MAIDTNNRKNHFTSLKPYCIFAKEHCYIEVTEWANGEGKDVEINSNGRERSFKLTHGEFQALCVLFNYVEEK